MGEEYRTRIFKSGNSVAVRLPRALGFAEGEEVALVEHEDGRFTLWRESEATEVLDGLYGAFSDGCMSAGRGDIDQDERDWSGSPRDQAA